MPDGGAAIHFDATTQLAAILSGVRDKGRLGSGEVASLTGKLGFALCAFRPLQRREAEARYPPKLRIVCDIDNAKSADVVAHRLWLRFLAAHTPRVVPSSLGSLELTVSYSDGEGDKAGLGVAVEVWAKGSRHSR